MSERAGKSPAGNGRVKKPGGAAGASSSGRYAKSGAPTGARQGKPSGTPTGSRAGKPYAAARPAVKRTGDAATRRRERAERAERQSIEGTPTAISTEAQPASIQWFPGHMAKTRRMMADSLRLVDVVVELTDARIPVSSRNPEIDRIVGQKPRVVLLNKCDSADEAMTARWVGYYAAKGISAIPTDCRSGKGLKAFLPLVRGALSELLLRRERKGMSGQPIRMMIVGIPNVGKSSLINRLAGSRRTKVEDRPGVTRGKQWVTLEGGFELLDMPGVLWPKFEDPAVGERLAFTGAVKDDVLDIELLAMRLLWLLNKQYPELPAARYGLTAEETRGLDAHGLLALVGKKRGMLTRGSDVNTERAAITVIDEFRSGKLGRVTLEAPPEIQSVPGAAAAAQSSPETEADPEIVHEPSENAEENGDV